MTGKPPTENSRGLRLGNMAQIRDMWNEEIEAPAPATGAPKAALDNAPSARGNDDAAPVRAHGHASERVRV